MGGRGSNSMGRVGGQTAPQPAPTQEYTEGKYGLRVTEDFIDTVGPDNVLREVENVTDTLDMLGVEPADIREVLDTITSVPGRNGSVYAFYRSGEKIISAANIYISDYLGVPRRYAENVAEGYHPKGTTADDILSHEAGHAMATLINEMKAKEIVANGGSIFDTFDYKVNDKFEKDVVSSACKAVKKTPYGKGKKNAELINSISTYAAKNRAETVAEAVADVRANGKNANPLSLEIVDRMKAEYRRLKNEGY